MHGLTRARARGALCVLALAVLLCSAGPGWATTRVALVVGNGGYAAQNIPALPNPVNDARLMAEALETSGFEVRLVTDADQGAMRTAIEAFGEALERAGRDAVGLFYYAGHGVEVRGQNYLIPIGAEIAREVEFKTDAVPADWVLSWMEAAGNRLNMVVLDACRNNPYEGRYRGASQGLAQMDAPSGSLIAYSAAPGQVAVDGEGENSPYTAALAGVLAEPGLKVEDVFKRVRVTVEGATNGQQTPWESSSLRGDFYFVAKAEAPPAPEPATVTVVETVTSELTAQQLAARAYEAAERLHTVSSYQLVIDQFPDTLYAKLAQEQIGKLSRATTTPSTPSAEEAEAALGLTRAQRRLVQRGLAALEFDVGPADGVFGPRTRAGLARWQTTQGVPATGYLDVAAAATLREAGEAAPPPMSRRRMVQEALNILSEALTVARGVSDAFDRALVLKGIAGAQAAAGDIAGAQRSIAEALAAVRGITSEGNRTISLRKIAGVQAEAGDVAGARATARGISDAKQRGWTLHDIAGVQAEAGDVAGARATARGISDAKQRGWTLHDIAGVQAEAGDVAGARATARGITIDWPRARTLGVIAGAQAAAGDVAGAQRSIAEALAAVRGITSEWNRMNALGAIAAPQAKAGDISGALATARGVSDEYYRARTLGVIAGAQAAAGDVAGAQQSIAEALAAVPRVSDAYDRARALIAIAGAQAAAGDVTGAQQSIAKALATVPRVSDASDHAMTLSATAERLLEAANPP